MHFGRAEPAYGHVRGPHRHLQFDFDLVALGFVGDMPDGIERATQMSDRLMVGAAPQCLGSSALMVRNGPSRRVTAFEMLGDLGGDGVGAGGPGGFEAGADSRVTLCSSRRGQPLIQKLAVKVMAEGAELGRRTVGP